MASCSRLGARCIPLLQRIALVMKTLQSDEGYGDDLPSNGMFFGSGATRMGYALPGYPTTRNVGAIQQPRTKTDVAANTFTRGSAESSRPSPLLPSFVHALKGRVPVSRSIIHLDCPSSWGIRTSSLWMCTSNIVQRIHVLPW